MQNSNPDREKSIFTTSSVIVRSEVAVAHVVGGEWKALMTSPTTSIACDSCHRRWRRESIFYPSKMLFLDHPQMLFLTVGLGVGNCVGAWVGVGDGVGMAVGTAVTVRILSACVLVSLWRWRQRRVCVRPRECMCVCVRMRARIWTSTVAAVVRACELASVQA